MIDFITSSGYENELVTLMEGFKLVHEWKMSYRSFIQHRIRNSLNVLDPLEPECLSLVGKPSNEIQAVENLKELYRKAVYNLSNEFDGIYSEPNKAAFAVSEEFKDIVIRADDNKNGAPRLKNQWRKLYRAFRGDIWPDEYKSSKSRRNISSQLKVPLLELANLCEVNNFKFIN